MKNQTIQDLRDAWDRVLKSSTPRQHFLRMVDRGLIDSEGRLTKKYGGTAESEEPVADQGHDSSANFR